MADQADYVTVYPLSEQKAARTAHEKGKRAPRSVMGSMFLRQEFLFGLHARVDKYITHELNERMFCKMLLF